VGKKELVDAAADRIYSQDYDIENQSLYEHGLNHPRIRKFQENLIAGIYQDWVDEVITESNYTEDMLPLSLVN
jgi:hypothetical protein